MITYDSLDPMLISDYELDEINLLLPQLTKTPKPLRIDELVAIAAKGEVVVAFEDGTIKAMATLAIIKIPTATIGVIEDVVVDVSLRGRGVATALILRLIEYAKEVGIQRIELTSKPERAEANRLYQKLGFKLPGNKSVQDDSMKNIVTIGGGGGHAQVLKGLKALPDVAITAICPSTDSGGSTGDLIRDYGCLGYLGDLTKCIAALCPDEKLSEALMRRFEGGCLHGHSLKNLLLLGLTQTNGVSHEDALRSMYQICGIGPHRVIPVSLERTELCAKLKFGGNVMGETHIDNLANNPLWSADIHAIKSIYLQPAVQASPQATDAIRDADYCIICPGDLYSSIMPVLLPRGMKRSLQQTKACIIVVLNVMTKRGETDGYCAEDFIRETESRMGRRCDVILYNDSPIPPKSVILYRLERKIRLSSRKLKADPRLMRISTVTIDTNGRIYHDPNAIRKAVQKIFGRAHPSGP